MKKIIQSFKKLYQFFFEFHPHDKELQKEYDTIFPYSMNEESSKVPLHGTMDIFVQKNV